MWGHDLIHACQLKPWRMEASGSKNQVRLRSTNGKSKFHRTRVGGFWLYSSGFNRPANVKLTPMDNTLALKVW